MLFPSKTLSGFFFPTSYQEFCWYYWGPPGQPLRIRTHITFIAGLLETSLEGLPRKHSPVPWGLCLNVPGLRRWARNRCPTVMTAQSHRQGVQASLEAWRPGVSKERSRRGYCFSTSCRRRVKAPRGNSLWLKASDNQILCTLYFHILENMEMWWKLFWNPWAEDHFVIQGNCYGKPCLGGCDGEREVAPIAMLCWSPWRGRTTSSNQPHSCSAGRGGLCCFMFIFDPEIPRGAHKIILKASLWR